MNIIYIDTTDNTKVVVGLTVGQKTETVERPLDTRKAQVVLPLIQELLKKHNLQMADIESIEVNPGPGSFTGVRVGVSIANALGFALGIPVNGKKTEEPKY